MVVIQITQETKNKIDKLKIHHREPYAEVIERILKTNEKYYASPIKQVESI